MFLFRTQYGNTLEPDICQDTVTDSKVYMAKQKTHNAFLILKKNADLHNPTTGFILKLRKSRECKSKQ